MDFDQTPTTTPYGLPTYMTEAELAVLAAYAAEVPAGGLILEIGGCYGGSTATMANANPRAFVLCVDEFSWSPVPPMIASAQTLLDNVRSAGAPNVAVLPTDSHIVGKHWTRPIDLLFVDGGHEYEDCAADLADFAPHAATVCVHDYRNNGWPGVEQAVSEFCTREHFAVAEVADWCVVLKRSS
jgi:predicted O-methyltransferase YrrM